MTREEAIKVLSDRGLWGIDSTGTIKAACQIALTALRPVSREQVEKMKKEPVEGEYDELYAPTYKCTECGFENIGRGNFCRNCGCLHTDEAMEMVLERLNKLED